MPYFSPEYPVLLFPVRIEARFHNPRELLIRIFPDEVFLSSFNPTLTKGERKDRDLFIKVKNSGEGIEDAWKKLVGKYGQYRASWLINKPNDEIEHPVDSAPGQNPTEIFYAWLPDYFQVYITGIANRTENEVNHTQRLSNIPIDRISGDKDLLFFAGEGEEWLNSFERAQAIGLGGKINLPIDLNEISRLVVVGIRSEEMAPTSERVKSLFKHHQYTSGLSLLEYGSPTNNVKEQPTPYSSSDEYEVVQSFESAVNGRKPGKTHKGFQLAEALGVPEEAFSHIPGSNTTQPTIPKLVQQASWFSLGGQMLRMLLGDHMSNEAHEEIWDFYSEFVNAQGPLPSIQLDNQPYGILPITGYKKILENGSFDTPIAKLERVLIHLMDRWHEMAVAPRPDETNAPSTNYVPRMIDVPQGMRELELARILSMEPHSTNFQLRMMELERIPGWYADLVSPPQALQTFPPYLIRKLLQRHRNHSDMWAFIEENIKELESAIPEITGLPDEVKSKLFQAEALSLQDVVEIPLNEFFEDSIPLLPLIRSDEWYKKAFKSLLDYLEKATPTDIHWYEGESFFLLDLILQSFTSAMDLYNRDIYFQPSLDDVEGKKSYTIKIISTGRVNKGDEVLKVMVAPGSDEGISVKAPFDGELVNLYVEDGDSFSREQEKKDNQFWDRKLFRLKNTDEQERIRTKIVSIGRKLIKEIDSLENEGLGTSWKDQLTGLTEALDLNTFRLDAWLTAIATRRIKEKREQNPEGMYVGAFGWLENLERQNQEPADGKGGIIHTSSISQTVAACMFRDSYSGYVNEEGGNIFTLNLTSKRVKGSIEFQQGLRQAQEIEALLGYKFERHLHLQEQNSLITSFREAYPLKVSTVGATGKGTPDMSVVNGLALLKDPSPPILAELKDEQKTAVASGLDLLKDVIDGSADTSFFEAGFHTTQGNFSQAAAAGDAARGKAEPPILESMDTRIPQQGQEHKLALLMEVSSGMDYPAESNPKASLEPNLERWIGSLIGPLDRIGARIETSRMVEGESERQLTDHGNVSLGGLGVGYLDLLQLSTIPLGDDASEIAQRLIKHAIFDKGKSLEPEETYSIQDPSDDNVQSISDVFEVLGFVRTLLRESRSLQLEDIASDSEINQIFHGPELAAEEKSRIESLVKKIGACVEELSRDDISLEALARYDIQYAKGGLIKEEEEALQKGRAEGKKLAEKVEKEIKRFQAEEKESTSSADEQKWFSFPSRFTKLEEICQMLFGEPFYLLHTFKASEDFQQQARQSQAALVGQDGQVLREEMVADNAGNEFRITIMGGQERIFHWLEGRAAVSSQAEAFSDLLMVADALLDEDNRYVDNHAFHIVQYSRQNKNGEQFPWTALDKTEIINVNGNFASAPYPDNAKAIVIWKPDSLAVGDLEYCGLLVDSFSDFLPAVEVDTGVGFEYNSPNAEPPQSFLLAVSPDDEAWTLDKLKDMVDEAMDLYKVRMVDTDAMRGFSNLFPMINWFNIPKTL